VMASLARGGFIRSTRGPSGGHELIQPPEQITIAAIAQAIDVDGPVVPDLGDPIRRFWNGLQDVERAYLRHTTVASLAAHYQASTPTYSI
jgi:DNA-binding IscR family transcriptional regulator